MANEAFTSIRRFIRFSLLGDGGLALCHVPIRKIEDSERQDARLPRLRDRSKVEYEGFIPSNMKRSRFSETQIVSILKEADTGVKVADLCRKHGISQPTYYNWKSKYGGLSVSELKRIKELEAEHSKLKRMYADLAMENDALKELLEKKPWSQPNAGER